jgi:hypothetical protein
MTTSSPLFRKLIESSPAAAEFLQNVTQITICRSPEDPHASAGDDLCWVYQGPTARNGFAYVGRETMVRRAYERLVGPIPAGQCPWQKCRNKLCVNPRHLVLRTTAEIRSAIAARLSPDEREQVRDFLASGDREIDVARKFGITQSAVASIKSKFEYAQQLSLGEWLDKQSMRLGPVGQLARGEEMPDRAREIALSKAAKEYGMYQLLTREYEARRDSERKQATEAAR